MAPTRYVLGIGHATLDHLLEIDRFPEPDTKAEIASPRAEGGGPAATAMVAAARLGERARLVSVVGDDGRGREIVAGLAAEGVEADAVQVRPASESPCSFVLVERSTGRRTILWSRGSAPPLRPEEVPAGLVEGAAALLVDGLQPAAQLEACRRARDARVPVVFDGGSVREDSAALLALADHALVSERFARTWAGSAGREGLESLCRATAGRVAITRGPEGCEALAGGRHLTIPALPAERPDSNGAGDVFHGAYLVGLVRGLGFEECLRLGNAAAGLKCRVPGPRRGIPVLAEALAAAGL